MSNPMSEDHTIMWDIDGVSPEVVLHWARQVADGADTTSVILTRASEDGPVTMDGRATLMHHDVTEVGTFTVVLWADRPDRPGLPGRRGGDYAVRYQFPNAEAAQAAGVRVPERKPPRPRVRVLHADPDKDPVLVVDRWAGDPDEIRRLDVREAGFSGVLVFREDVDLDDDGLDEVAR